MLLEIIEDRVHNVLAEKTEFFIEQVKANLENQGHNASGTLRDSIRYEINKIPGIVQSIVYMRSYGFYIDRGVAAKDIPFSGFTGGGGKSDYIEGLRRYWILKGLDGDEALRAAFATAMKHKKEGMPTQSSSAFSDSGKRTGFFSDAVYDLRSEIDSLNKLVGEEFRVAIVETISNFTRDFEKLAIEI